MRRSLLVGLVSVALFPAAAGAQPKEGLILFKDGFSLQGKVVEMRDLIIDPATGASFPVPAGGLCLYLDDGVRRVFFAPTQLDRVVPRKDKELIDRMVLGLPRWKGVKPFLPGWSLEEVGEWNSKWQRSLRFSVTTSTRPLEMEQRIVLMSNYQIQIETRHYHWNIAYFTREWGAEKVRTFIWDFMKEQKAYKDKDELDKRLDIARFLNEAGWHKEADEELEKLERKFFEQVKRITPLRTAAKAALANALVDDMERAHKIGQSDFARRLLERYQKEEMATIVADRRKLLAEEIRSKYEGLAEKVDEAAKALVALPERTVDKVFWRKAVAEIRDGLNEDTLPRLESFATYAAQYRRDLDEKRTPSQSAEQVLALALTGWLQGNVAAEPEPKLARQLWQARELVQSYLQATNGADKTKILASVSKADEVHIDQVARMIQFLPPVRSPDRVGEKGAEKAAGACGDKAGAKAGIKGGGAGDEKGARKKFTTEIEERSIELEDSDGGSYLVQLPPEYHPHRSYPLLLLLSSSRDKTDDMVKRFSAQAAREGYILAAPTRGKGVKSGEYGYTEKEQRSVLDCLRDIKQVYNIDSDRVFLFGWEAGGDMAYDVGLSHPDLFAGVIPMNANPQFFTLRYATNAQYLPLYVIEGERNAGKPKANRTLFKELVGNHYPAVYVEYKGRMSEWYATELETVFDWMNRKKRFHPLRQMGIYNTGGGRGEEFKTSRRADNRFYWLSTTAIADAFINDARAWKHHTLPATLQASISMGNELELKPGEKGPEVKGAKVWTSIHVRTKGVKNFTLWITPAMHDFKRPLQVKWDGKPLSIPRMIQPNLAVMLEDYAYNGDRQRLPYARISTP
ncbi:MAG: hypothetical protein U0793_09725 [Gemmataceae bacterium]